MSEETTIADLVASSRSEMLKRWLLEIDPVRLPPPNDLTFQEISKALDEIEARVAVCRRLYPWSAPANTVDAVIRSMPPHLRAGSRQDTARVDAVAACRTYSEIHQAPAEGPAPRSTPRPRKRKPRSPQDAGRGEGRDTRTS